MIIKPLKMILAILFLPFTMTYLIFKIPLDICHSIGKHLPRLVYYLCFLCLYPFGIVMKMCCIIYEPIYNAIYKSLWIPKGQPEEATHDDYNSDINYDEYLDIEYKVNINLIHCDDTEDSYYDSDRFKLYQELTFLKKEYDDIFQKHIKLQEEIGHVYSVANNYTGYDSKEMLLCVEKCNEDFGLIPDILEFYHNQKAIYNKYGIERSDYTACPYSVKRMLIIMEKMGKYDEALNLCQWALSHGLTRDGTEGGIIGRMARIAKKKEK